MVKNIYNISYYKLRKIENLLNSTLDYTINEINYDVIRNYYTIVFNKNKDRLCNSLFNKYKITFDNIEEYIDSIINEEFDDMGFVNSKNEVIYETQFKEYDDDYNWLEGELIKWADNLDDYVFNNKYYFLDDIEQEDIFEEFDLYAYFIEYVKRMELSLKIKKIIK